MTSLAHVVTGSNWIRCVAAAALVSLGLASGCAYAPSFDGDPASAAAAVPTTTVAPAPATPDPQSLPALSEVLAEERFVPFVDALARSGLDKVIEGLDDFVLLAPTRTAFESSATDVGVHHWALIDNPQLFEAIIRYHVVADPSVNESWRTLNGAVLDVNGSDLGTIDGVGVLERIPVRNGIVLVMPQLLLPASQPGRAALPQATQVVTSS